MDRMRLLPAFLLAAALLAGCASPSDGGAPTDSSAILGDERIGGPQPITTKDTFSSTAPALLPAVMPGEPALTFEVPAGGSRVHLAYDLEGTAGPQISVRVVFADGATDEVATADPGKRVRVVDSAAAGTASLYAQSDAAWTVGAVVTVFPPGFDEGERVQVSTPQQTQIEHKFFPGTLTVDAESPSRLTLYDYDPHGGIDNLQHNLHFPSLGLETEGKTTWGEVRVLDLPPLAAGTYAFECEFHGFQGQLVVGAPA